jgi:hypothetical protein
MGWKTGWCTHQSITGVTIGVTIGASIGVATGIDVTKDEKVGGGSIGVSIGASLSSMTGRVVAIGTLFTFDFNGDIDGNEVGGSSLGDLYEVQNSLGGPATVV